MNVVNAPLAHVPRSSGTRQNLTVRAMEVGQHVIAAALTIIGVVRAIGDGSPVTIAIMCGAAILAWHTAGAILPARVGARTAIVWWLMGFAVIWLAAVAFSPEFVWLAFLLWLLAGHLLPLPWGIAFSALVLVVAIGAPVVHHGTTSYANVIGPLIGSVFAFGISRGYVQLLRDGAEREHLVASLTRAQQEMSELQDELALAQRESGAIAERTRISRDIHDTIAQAMSSIRLLAIAGVAKTADAEAVRTLTQVGALAGDSLADVRRIVADLAPAELDEDALTSALRRLLERTREETGLQVELHHDASLGQLPTEIEVALLRTAQSALANVRQHAGATRIVATLSDAGSAVRLDIIDDGRGFDVAEWEQHTPDSTSSYGLRFMRSRLRELGGGLDVESAPGDGTAISAHLPLHEATNRADEVAS